MADGSVKIIVEVDGKQVDVASDSLDDLQSSAQGAGKGTKQAEDGLKNVGKESTKASKGIKDFAISLGLVKIGAAAFNALKSSMDSAITRFDTLNKFPKVLQSLGVSAGDSERAMKRLSDGIDGLPTKLNEIAATAQRMYTSFNDMDKATDTALALNNALLGSGASAADAQRGTDQYLQVLQRGKFEMEEWKTLQETMDVGLIKIAEGFGFAGKSAKEDLYAALKEGTISMDEFNNKLIEVGTGTGELAKLAKVNSLGLATSFENLKNSATKGIADIIDSFNRLSREATGKELAEHIDGLKVIVNTSFKVMGSVIEATTPILILFTSGVKVAIPVVNALTPAIIGLMTAYAAYTVITKARDAIEASNAVLKVAMASKKALTISTKAQTMAEIKEAAVKEVLSAAKKKDEVLTKAQIATRAKELIATNAQAVATTAQTGVISLNQVAIGLLTGQMKLSTVATIAKTAASAKLSATMTLLSGPIGWVTLGIGALVTATVAVVKWFKRSTEEGKKLKKETDDLGESTDALSENVNSTSEAYKENQNQLKSTAKANRDLIGRIEELSNKENKSAEDKLLLTGYINNLNESVEGLNLSYNEESDSLSESSTKLRERIDLIEEETSFNDALARQTEITQEQIEVELQRKETNDLMAEATRLREEGSITNSEYRKRIGELDIQEQALIETEERLKEENIAVTEQVEAGAKAVAEATGESVESQIIDYEKLEGVQKETFDKMISSYEELVDSASDAFDKMSTESKVSAEEMIANLEHNQEVTAQWGENVASLMGRAGEEGNEGFIAWLETMGPDSAAELAEVANMSDEELDRFIELMNEAPKVATDSFKTSLGGGMDEAVEQMAGHVNSLSQTTKEQMEAAGFDEIGKAIPEGLSGGIEKGTHEVEKAAKNMADDTTKESKRAFGIQSPSTVFKQIGADVTEGLALGINGGTAKVIQAIRKMFKGVQMDSVNSFKTITKDYDRAINDIEKSLEKLPKITQKSMKNMLDRLKSGAGTQVQEMNKLSRNLLSPFNSTQSQFNSIGRNAMNGLNAGLNAGKPRVMATARSIANSVATTMKNSLKIHSPSRVMKDDVGRWIPEGIAIGIEDKASVVYDALNKMTGNMVRFSTPEAALGLSGMGANASTIQQFSNKNTSKTINNNNKPTIIIEKIENYSDTDIPRILEESAWIMDREGAKLDG